MLDREKAAIGVLISLQAGQINQRGQRDITMDAQLKFLCHRFSHYQYAEVIGTMNKNASGLIGKRVQFSNQPQPASFSSIVFDEDSQPFGVSDALALKEDNAPISDIPQADEPVCAAIVKLVANF